MFVFFLPPTLFCRCRYHPTPVAPQPTCVISADPNTVTIGGTVQVRWSSTNATVGSITHIGEVGLLGSINVLPSSAAKTTFTATFVGPGGVATCAKVVSVSSGSASGESANPYTICTDPNNTSGAYTTGTDYTTGASYNDGTPYKNPAPTSQPSGNSFSQTQQTITTGGSGSGGVRQVFWCHVGLAVIQIFGNCMQTTQHRAISATSANSSKISSTSS